ncbi:MAG: hypothetical protein JWO92_1168 [Chitinophagaceae bacterium]|nr:hypothetical protein [Chitinophagaceae bacterium]
MIDRNIMNSKRSVINLFLIVICLLFSANAFCQEQFEKRFDIILTHEPFMEALKKLAKTQPDMILMGNKSVFERCPPITLNLHNVTFDEAMNRILASQAIFKDYVVIDHGSPGGLRLQLKTENGTKRYIDKNKNKSRYYHLGDELPDSSYSVDNYPSKKIKLSDFKNKLIILDMWNISCAGCIMAMPKMEELQEQFKGEVQILLVTRDSKDEVSDLKKKVEIVRDNKLPSITGENLLGFMFNYFSVPTQVWIDGSGKIRYITNKLIANEQNIKNFLSGKYLNLYETKDTVVSQENPFTTSLKFINNGKFTVSSYLGNHNETKYHYYGESGMPIKDADTVKWIAIQNIDLYNLYKVAYGVMDLAHFSNCRILRDYINPEKYDPDETTSKNMYDYELITQKIEINRQKFCHIMQQELDNSFDVLSSMQKKPIPCYILKRNGKTSKLNSAGKQHDFILRADSVLTASDVTLGYILDYILYKCQNTGVLINESGLDAKMEVDCTINIDLEHNLEGVNKSLAPYGLVITKEVRTMECIVLEDNK